MFCLPGGARSSSSTSSILRTGIVGILRWSDDTTTSAGERLGEKRQALVHPVIDSGMVVGELLVAVGNTKLVQPPHEPARAVEQIELILLAAVNVERLQPAEVVRVGFDRHCRVLAQPIR